MIGFVHKSLGVKGELDEVLGLAESLPSYDEAF
jgi:hypothetical protein